MLNLLIVLLVSSPAFAELKNESEAGVVVANGNSRAQTFNLKQKSDYVAGVHTYTFTGAYLKSKQNGVDSAEAWNLGLRYEQALSDSFSIFAAQNAEGDQFAGIRQRYNTDLGGKYFFAKREKDLIAFTEAGYRFTRENTTRGAQHSFHKSRLYAEIEKYFTAGTSGKLWAEFVPNFTVSRNWLLNSEASLSSALNDTFALKTAFLVKHNHTPPVATAQKTDTLFTTALTAKF